jgi:hypothetical protein
LGAAQYDRPFCGHTDRYGKKHGDKQAATQREYIMKLTADPADKPNSANGLRNALRTLMKHAIEIKLRRDDPTQGMKALRPKSKLGSHRWIEIAQFKEKHPVGTKPRLALALGLYTGQARQDVVVLLANDPTSRDVRARAGPRL